jgi:hypothetical protein
MDKHRPARALYIEARQPDSTNRDPPEAPEHSVVHMVLVLALFRFCSSDERNTTQHHDISRHIKEWL